MTILGGPYTEGVSAFESGMSIYSNPYEIDTHPNEYSSWITGYNDAWSVE